MRNNAARTPGVKDQAKQLVEQLPEDSSWDDLMYQVYVRQAIECGLDDSENGRTTSVEEIRARFKRPA